MNDNDIDEHADPGKPAVMTTPPQDGRVVLCTADDVRRLRHRVSLLPKEVRASRSKVWRKLMAAGWDEKLLTAELDAALNWGKSAALVAEQERERNRRKACGIQPLLFSEAEIFSRRRRP
jgi:hypothetical protein